MTASTTLSDKRSTSAGPTDANAPEFAGTDLPKTSFAGTLAQQAMAWHRPDWTEIQITHDITRIAVAMIPAARGAAILLMTAPGELTLGASCGAVPDLDVPAHFAAGQAHTIADLPSANRWPVFTAPSSPGWPGRTICTPLGSGHTMFGTLLLTVDGGPGSAASTTAMLGVLAMHASIALAAGRDRTHLHLALTSRDVIGQAKGILMERRRITADAAFTELTRLSQTGNVKLRELCEQLTATGHIPEPPSRTDRAPHR